MSAVVELKRNDVKGFWKCSKLFREKFSPAGESDETSVQSIMIEYKFLPVSIANLRKRSPLSNIIEICKYWGTDTLPTGLLRIISEFDEEEVLNNKSIFIKNFHQIDKYFDELKGIEYDNVVQVPTSTVGNSLPLKFEITGDVKINGRFRTLSELICISERMKDIRKFLSPYQIREWFCHVYPNNKFDFEMILLGLINEDVSLLDEFKGEKIYDRRFRLQTGNNRMDRPTFSINSLADRYSCPIAFKRADIIKMEEIEMMIENKSTPFSFDSFTAYLGKPISLQYLLDNKIRFNKFTLRYAKQGERSDCVNLISQNMLKSRRW